MKKLLSFWTICLFVSSIANFSIAQNNNYNTYPKETLQSMRWRCIGPYRGGRSLAVCGHKDQPYTFYFGATGGGVWKSIDGGTNWVSISDSVYKSSSVGAITVAPSNPNILYVGMGETDIRGNISMGDGMYKSTDAGRSWKKIGLEKTKAIARIVVHPNNPDILYVAAMGNIFGKNNERGIFRSKDGGNSWEQILMKNDSTGAIEIQMDPNNSNILYAALWEAKRNNYSMSSGGEGSGMYRSADGGNTWENISKRPGLPVGILGKIGIAISPANSNRIWAMIENKNGGLYRSDDGGNNWSLINTDKNLIQRPWYYCEIEADPKDEHTLYVMNVGLWRTKDGGKTFAPINNNHGDTHDLWINPNNPLCMILGDDGGAAVTYNGGINWSELDLPTAQFYHVSVDNDFPYSVYGAQQDNSTVKIKSRTDHFSIDETDWYPVAGGESGYVVADPKNPDITYGGSYMGDLTKYDYKLRQNQNINVYPVGTLGAGAEDMKYRFQWTYPIVFSPHNSNIIYVTSQYVHRSTNEGMSWEIISPELTKGDTSTLKSSGGPITKDNTGAETFSTIFTFAESPVQAGVFWAGSDDGLIHMSKDNGKNWERLTINGLPDWALMSMVEASHFDAGTAYLAANRYKLNDSKPYLFKTNDFGKTWQKITNGLPDNVHCRVIREDPNKKGLLYAGTETGIYVSFNDGQNWQSLQLNLPLTPVHDIAIQKDHRDIAIATHGRSFWILDNVEPLYQINDQILNSKAWLFSPETSYKYNGGSYYSPDMQVGENAPSGVLLNYYLKDTLNKELTLEFFTMQGDKVIKYSSTKNKKGEPIIINKDFYQPEKIERPGILSANKGLNTFVWDSRYADATEVEGGALMWSGSTIGPKACPGKYYAALSIGDSLIMKQAFEIKKDPRLNVSDEDLAESLRFQLQVRDKLSETDAAINQLRYIRTQINDYLAAQKDTVWKKEIDVLVKPIVDSLSNIEMALIQKDAKAFQDLLALPVRLNDKLAGLASQAASADTKPTAQTYQAYQDINELINIQMAKLNIIISEKLPLLNQKVDSRKLPVIKEKKE